MRTCLNWKVIAPLAVLVLVVAIGAPSLLSRALPLALLAACPLSMLFGVSRVCRAASGASASEQLSEQQREEINKLRDQIDQLRAELTVRELAVVSGQPKAAALRRAR